MDQWYSDQKPEGPNYGVLDCFSIEEAVVYINELPQKTSKNNAPNFLKGL